MNDAGWMVNPGCVSCALRLEPYAFVRFKMQDAGQQMTSDK